MGGGNREAFSTVRTSCYTTHSRLGSSGRDAYYLHGPRCVDNKEVSWRDPVSFSGAGKNVAACTRENTCVIMFSNGWGFLLSLRFRLMRVLYYTLYTVVLACCCRKRAKATHLLIVCSLYHLDTTASDSKIPCHTDPRVYLPTAAVAERTGLARARFGVGEIIIFPLRGKGGAGEVGVDTGKNIWTESISIS